MAAANGGGAAAHQRLVTAAIAAYARRPHPVALCCGIQRYTWGDRRFIPDLLGRPSPAAGPQAELWIGAHPDLPADVCLHPARVPLDGLIAAMPAAVLGAYVARRFDDTLPFLFKVLAAATPLSIQAHPNRAQAEQGFMREDRLELALSDPKRSYRDRKHKPELLVALTDFHALRGFRPLGEIAAELRRWPPLAHLCQHLDGGTDGLRALYADFMRLPQAAVDALLAPVVVSAQSKASDPKDPSCERSRWLLNAHRRFSQPGHCDRGLLSLLLLNLLRLRPGQAMFLPAGELHSYLQGSGMELMANSNNVLRGGLTDKHIDVEALLEVLRVEPHAPEILAPATWADDPRWQSYTPPVAEFSLHRLRLTAGDSVVLAPTAVMLGLVLAGELEIGGDRSHLRLGRGGTCLVPAEQALRITTRSGVDCTLATIPATLPSQ